MQNIIMVDDLVQEIMLKEYWNLIDYENFGLSL